MWVVRVPLFCHHLLRISPVLQGMQRNGILVKGSVYLEQLGKIDTLAFDKTGTLTKGAPYVETV